MSYIIGTVVKKSKNAIGCLVHDIFNASSIIPPKTARDQWCGNHVNEGDILEIRITKLDLTASVPYIHGEILPDRYVYLSLLSKIYLINKCHRCIRSSI